MVFLEDFTKASAGQDIPLEGHVESCLRCGRPGVKQHGADGQFVVHAQISEVLGDGMRVEPRDCCEIRRP
jgi:hypothetical protein